MLIIVVVVMLGWSFLSFRAEGSKVTAKEDTNLTV